MPSYFQKGGGTAHAVCFPVFVPPSHLSHIVRNLLEKQGKDIFIGCLIPLVTTMRTVFPFGERLFCPGLFGGTSPLVVANMRYGTSG